MKSAFKKMSLRIGDEETLVPFTVSVQDDTERFTHGGKEKLTRMECPIIVKWPLVSLAFHDYDEVRRAFTVFGQFERIHPEVRDAVHELLDEIGVPRLKLF
jgi:hypothetical protein